MSNNQFVTRQALIETLKFLLQHVPPTVQTPVTATSRRTADPRYVAIQDIPEANDEPSIEALLADSDDASDIEYDADDSVEPVPEPVPDADDSVEPVPDADDSVVYVSDDDVDVESEPDDDVDVESEPDDDVDVESEPDDDDDVESEPDDDDGVEYETDDDDEATTPPQPDVEYMTDDDHNVEYEPVDGDNEVGGAPPRPTGNFGAIHYWNGPRRHRGGVRKGCVRRNKYGIYHTGRSSNRAEFGRLATTIMRHFRGSGPNSYVYPFMPRRDTITLNRGLFIYAVEISREHRAREIAAGLHEREIRGAAGAAITNILPTHRLILPTSNVRIGP